MASVVRSDIIPFLFETFFLMSSSDLQPIIPFFEVDQEVSELWLSPLASLLSSRVINTHVYLDLVYQLSTYLVRSFLSWFIGSLIRVFTFPVGYRRFQPVRTSSGRLYQLFGDPNSAPGPY